MQELLELIKKFAKKEYSYHPDKEEKLVQETGHIILGAADSGGYDICDGVIAEFTDEGITVRVGKKEFNFIPEQQNDY